jgi:hypothetical protein
MYNMEEYIKNSPHGDATLSGGFHSYSRLWESVSMIGGNSVDYTPEYNYVSGKAGLTPQNWNDTASFTTIRSVMNADSLMNGGYWSKILGFGTAKVSPLFTDATFVNYLKYSTV